MRIDGGERLLLSPVFETHNIVMASLVCLCFILYLLHKKG